MKRLLLTAVLFISASASSIIQRLEETKEDSPVEIKVGESEILDAIPQDHIFGVKMERDGDGNMNYHKEVFLGSDAEKFENGDYQIKDQRKRLGEIFAAVDRHSDGVLDEMELTDWILTKTREHFYEARMYNKRVVEYLDVDKNDEISWNEFISHYLSENGRDKSDRNEILAKLESGGNVEMDNLESAIQDLREKWIRVQDIGKKSLTYAQFFDFQHPEMSSEMLKYLVEDILHDMDTDNSNDVTIQEYVAMDPGADVDASREIWVVERRKEFRNVIDRDKDGLVTVQELELYLDPLSQTMAGQEARQLIGFGDSNEDGKLTLEEILENSEFYTGSKLYNYAESVHEEF